MTLKILILEDDPQRITTFHAKLSRHTLVFTDTAADAIAWIQREAEAGQAFDVIFLDHDLGGQAYVSQSDPNTGSEVVRWLTTYGGVLEQPYIIIHSMNTPAAEAMEKNLANHGFEFIYRIPFTQLISKYLDDPSFLQ
jgi:CheY-like chemotaxis protein